MDSNVFAISSMLYILADYPERLPKWLIITIIN
jgi:hypothetical protein